jgi:hypothetical protein
MQARRRGAKNVITNLWRGCEFVMALRQFRGIGALLSHEPLRNVLYVRNP